MVSRSSKKASKQGRKKKWKVRWLQEEVNKEFQLLSLNRLALKRVFVPLVSNLHRRRNFSFNIKLCISRLGWIKNLERYPLWPRHRIGQLTAKVAEAAATATKTVKSAK